MLATKKAQSHDARGSIAWNFEASGRLTKRGRTHSEHGESTATADRLQTVCYTTLASIHLSDWSKPQLQSMYKNSDLGNTPGYVWTGLNELSEDSGFNSTRGKLLGDLWHSCAAHFTNVSTVIRRQHKQKTFKTEGSQHGSWKHLHVPFHTQF